MKQIINIKKLHPKAILPHKSSEDAAGYDVHSLEACVLPVGGRVRLGTGLVVVPPLGFHLEIRPRSGMAFKHGVTVLNAPGTVDADYRGELQIVLINHGDQPFYVHEGDRIAQILLRKNIEMVWNLVEELDETARGVQGWGHTGE